MCMITSVEDTQQLGDRGIMGMVEVMGRLLLHMEQMTYIIDEWGLIYKYNINKCSLNDLRTTAYLQSLKVGHIEYGHNQAIVTFAQLLMWVGRHAAEIQGYTLASSELAFELTRGVK